MPDLPRICHKLTAETAKGLAYAAYEILASGSDAFYRRWPNPHQFTKRHWKDFIGHARASMAVMLQPIPGTENEPNGPRYLSTESMREAIYECFLAEGGYKEVPQPVTPSASELARYGGLN